jgi:polyisoprenoid-binding protein YceI
MKRVSLTVMVLLSLSPQLEAANWFIDQTASHVIFTATFEGTKFNGRIAGITGTVVFDPESPQAGRINVSFDVRSADVGSPDLNNGLALPEWFDFAHYPVARFVSDSITVRSPSSYEANGVLTIKGISRPVTLPFSFEMDSRSAVIRGTTTLRRTDFNVGEGDWASGEAIGLDVRLDAEIVLKKKRLTP